MSVKRNYRGAGLVDKGLETLENTGTMLEAAGSVKVCSSKTGEQNGE
jgi:hypothetical protein